LFDLFQAQLFVLESAIVQVLEFQVFVNPQILLVLGQPFKYLQQGSFWKLLSFILSFASFSFQNADHMPFACSEFSFSTWNSNNF